MHKISCNHDRDINGVVWNTAEMWSDFERFGSCMCLDVIKHSINKILWPHTVIRIINDLDKVCVGCEGFFYGEIDLPHLFVVKFLLTSTPAFPENKACSVSSNVFLISQWSSVLVSLMKSVLLTIFTYLTQVRMW